MRTGMVRNLRDAKRYAAACERETGVVPDAAWVLDAGGKVVAHRGALLGGYVLETGECSLTEVLIPRAAVTLPDSRVFIAAFWVHHGLSPRLRRRVSRQLVRDVRRSGRRHAVVVTPNDTPDPVLVHGLPTQLYAGCSGHADVGWIQVRVGTASTLRRAVVRSFFELLFGARPQAALPGPELTGPIAVPSK